MTNLICMRYPEMAFIQDIVGHLPLHLAITKDSIAQSRLSSVQLYQQAYFISSLLALNPYAACQAVPCLDRCKAKQHPLHQAISSGLLWNLPVEDPGFSTGPVQALFLCCPDALESEDDQTGLSPFLLASTIVTKTDICQIDTVFNLLRLCPSMVKEL